MSEHSHRQVAETSDPSIVSAARVFLPIAFVFLHVCRSPSGQTRRGVHLVAFARNNENVPTTFTCDNRYIKVEATMKTWRNETRVRRLPRFSIFNEALQAPGRTNRGCFLLAILHEV